MINYQKILNKNLLKVFIEILKEVGLDGHVTSQRTNGFLSALETLKKRTN